MMPTPSIRTTVVGSYPVPDWLINSPSQQGLIDATRVVFKTQEMAGVDAVVDGELYRWDVNHPDTNGMIEYFIRPMEGIRSEVTRSEVAERIETAARIVGPDRIRWVHPDCGFWMNRRSVADRKIANLVRGRDLFLGTKPEV
jgi:methionine synthase II (cobalamin-independent)